MATHPDDRFTPSRRALLRYAIGGAISVPAAGWLLGGPGSVRVRGFAAS